MAVIGKEKYSNLGQWDVAKMALLCISERNWVTKNMDVVLSPTLLFCWSLALSSPLTLCLNHFPFLIHLCMSVYLSCLVSVLFLDFFYSLGLFKPSYTCAVTLWINQGNSVLTKTVIILLHIVLALTNLHMNASTFMMKSIH